MTWVETDGPAEDHASVGVAGPSSPARVWRSSCPALGQVPARPQVLAVAMHCPCWQASNWLHAIPSSQGVSSGAAANVHAPSAAQLAVMQLPDETHFGS